MRPFAGRRARRSRHSILACFLLVTAFVAGRASDAAAQPDPAQRWDGFFELVTGRHDMAPPAWTPPRPADAPSRVSRHAISRDGRYVVFDSDATNWGYSSTALYRRDRRTGQTELLLAGPARNASISADGQHIAFEICEPFMRPDSASICDAWALDLRTWTWSLLSGTPSGTFGSHDSGGPILSADGRFAVFSSIAPNLTGDSSYQRHVVLRDRDPDANGVYDEPGTAVLDTISVGVAAFGDGDSATPEVSDDGRFVAFRSAAANLVAGDTNGTWDVFLRDRQAGETRRLNVRPQGEQSPVWSDEPQISMSADGRYVAFSSLDGELAPSAIDDINGDRDVFVYDRQTSALTRIDVGRADGAPTLGYGPTGWPTLSADGRYVSVESAATNVDVPPTGNIGQAYVVDRTTGQATRISAARLGLDNDVAGSRPTISGDGSVVLFWSTATAFARFEQPPVAEQLYAAVHLSIAPAEVTVPARGGQATFTVTTHPHTLWWALWDPTTFPWVLPAEAPQGIGSGTMRFTVDEANPAGTARSATIALGDATATVTQEAGLSLTSLTPASGPIDGGTVVTLTGTGFEPGMIVYFGGAQAGVEYVDVTTLRVTTSPSANAQPGIVPVAVGTDDGRYAWLDWAFEYTAPPDATPPMVMGWPAGPEGQNGWFVGDVTITWGMFDGESPITSPPCPTIVVTQDTAGTTYTCEATSAGGTAVGSVTVRRDATAPVIVVASPVAGRLYNRNAVVASTFTCSDTTSGVSTCGMAAPSGPPVDTATPGWRTFSTDAVDQAGNIGSVSVEYAVGTGICTPYPDGLQTWLAFPFLSDWMSSDSAMNGGMPTEVFVTGVVGQALQFGNRTYGTLDVRHDGRLAFTSAMSVAAWLKPGSAAARLITHPQFLVDRNANGTVTWTLLRPAGEAAVVRTSTAVVPTGAWSFVVLAYDAGAVTLSVNGKLADSWQEAVPALLPMAAVPGTVLVGGLKSSAFYIGQLDELQFYDRALAPADVEALYLAGAQGTCVPSIAVNLFLTPESPEYTAGTFTVVGRLARANGVPLAGMPVTLSSAVHAPGATPPPPATLVTDAAGEVRWQVPFTAEPNTNPYAYTVRGVFRGTQQYHYAEGFEWVTVRKASTSVTWQAPAPITYGTSLGTTMFNAQGSVPGTISYSHSQYSTLSAGTWTLSATLLPTDYVHYDRSTTTVQIEVRKAIPTVTATSGTFTYDGWSHGANGQAVDFLGRALPVTTTYNGSSNPPYGAGTYAAIVSFAGDANHEPGSATATVTITKATPTIEHPGTTNTTYTGVPPQGLGSLLVTGVNGQFVGWAPISFTGVNVGSHTATATFPGNANYVERTLSFTWNIVAAAPGVTVASTTLTYDAQPHAAAVTVTGVNGEVPPGAVTITYNGSTAQPVAAGSYAVVATVAAAGNYRSASGNGTLTIAKAAAALTLPNLAVVYDGQPHPASVSATGAAGASLSPITVTYNGSTTVPVNAGTYAVEASFAGDANHAPGAASALVTIGKAAATLSWSTPEAVGYGTPLSAAQLNATASVPGTFAYSPAAGTVLGAGVAQPLTATFTPADTQNYESGTVSTTIAVQQAIPTVTVTGGAFAYDGQPHPATASVTGIGGGGLSPVTITYNGGTAVPINAGTYEVSASFAGDANHAPASGSATITIGKATATVSWNAPAAIGYGTPLSAGQLNATASVPGTFVYAPAAGTVLGAGSGQPMVATFTPSDAANYAGGTASTSIDVVRAPLVVRTNDVAKIYGAPLPAFAASFSGFVAGDTPASLAGALAFATAATSSSPVGTYAVTPAGLSSPNYAITFVAGTLSVLKAPVAMTLSASPTPSGLDMPITFTATVAAALGAPTAPAGTVRFFDGTTLLGTATLSGGTATLLSGGLTAGSHTIEARYDGDASFDVGTRTATHVVNTAAASPAITITSSRQPASVGQSISLTATISVATSGTIAFYDGGTLLGSGSIASGRATLTTSTLAAGSHAITARFQGTASAPPVISPVFVQAVNGGGSWKDRTSTMNLVSSANPSALGATVTFTATASGSSGAPTGHILFMVDGLIVGDPTGVPVTTVSSSAARATVSLPSLTGGRHKVTATYLGSSNYRGSNGALTQTVN